MMKTTATILFLTVSVHVSSFRQIGVYYKAMILELYILHAVGRVCMAKDPLPCHPGKDQNISGHIVLAQSVCVI